MPQRGGGGFTIITFVFLTRLFRFMSVYVMGIDGVGGSSRLTPQLLTLTGFDVRSNTL